MNILEFLLNGIFWCYARLYNIIVLLFFSFLFILFVTLCGTGIPLIMVGAWELKLNAVEMGGFLTLAGFFTFYLFEKLQGKIPTYA